MAKINMHHEPEFERPDDDSWKYPAAAVVVLFIIFVGLMAYEAGKYSRNVEVESMKSQTTLQQWDTENLLRAVSRYTCTTKGAVAEVPYGGIYRHWSEAEPISLLVVCEAGKALDPVKFQEFVCNTGQASAVLYKTTYCRP